MKLRACSMTWGSREAIISRVVTAMRDVGTPEREIECFKEDVDGADYATMLATAIGYQALKEVEDDDLRARIEAGEGQAEGRR